MVIVFPIIVHAQTFDLDEQGIIDEGGIMTNRAQEQAEVQEIFFEQEQKEQRSQYWIRVGVFVIAALVVFEVGIVVGGRGSKN